MHLLSQPMRSVSEAKDRWNCFWWKSEVSYWLTIMIISFGISLQLSLKYSCMIDSQGKFSFAMRGGTRGPTVYNVYKCAGVILDYSSWRRLCLAVPQFLCRFRGDLSYVALACLHPSGSPLFTGPSSMAWHLHACSLWVRLYDGVSILSRAFLNNNVS